MKKIVLFPLLLSCMCLLAQDYEITNSGTYVIRNTGLAWVNALGHDGTFFYLTGRSNVGNSKNYTLDKYDADLTPVYSKSIYGSGPLKIHYKTSFSNQKPILFLTEWDRSKKERGLYIRGIEEDGTLADGDTMLESQPGKGFMNMAAYSTAFSPDGSKLLVFTKKIHQKKSNEKIHLQVFSTADYKSLWKQDITLETPSQKRPKNYVAVNNDGVAYIFKKAKISKKEIVYQIFTAHKDQFNVEQLDLKDLHPVHNKMLIDQEGQLLLVAMMTKKETFQTTNWDANLFLSVSPDCKIIQQSMEPVIDKIMNSCLLKDALLTEDGGAILLTEYHTASSKNIGSPQATKYEYDRYHGNVNIFSFAKDGSLKWTNELKKNQEEVSRDVNHEFGSFAYQLKDNKLYLLWNKMDLDYKGGRTFDYPDGEKINVDEHFGKMALYPAMLSIINPDGQFEHSNLPFNAFPLTKLHKDQKTLMAIEPNFFFPTETGMVIFSIDRGMKSRKFKMSKIAF